MIFAVVATERGHICADTVQAFLQFTIYHPPICCLHHLAFLPGSHHRRGIVGEWKKQGGYLSGNKQRRATRQHCHQATLQGTKNCQHASNCWSKSTKVWCESSLAMQNCVNSILQKQYHMTWNSIRCYIWCIGQGLLCLYSPIISQFLWLDHFLAASLQLDTFILV